MTSTKFRNFDNVQYASVKMVNDTVKRVSDRSKNGRNFAKTIFERELPILIKYQNGIEKINLQKG